MPDLQFSILLPTHNRADVLPFAIYSVLAQTIGDFELLIVGDGCTDRTEDVVENFDDPRITWLNLPKAPNFGYANRNIALRQARGNYIAYMAHDDLWLPDHLELLLLCLKEPATELVYSRPLWVIPGGMIAPGTFNLEHLPTLTSFLARKQNGIPAGCVIHRRECFGKYGYWDETLPACADWDMWVRIIDGGGKNNFAFMNVPTCLHFRASWRTEATVIQQLGGDWQPFHALGESIPEILKIPLSGDGTEQETVWRAMSAHPQEWTKQVRAAVWYALNQRISNSNELIEGLNAELASQAAELASIRNSSAGKVAQFSHRIRILLAPPASRRVLFLKKLYNTVTRILRR